MKLLILGGSVFLGRGIVTAALERGHELTLFNRGQTNPGLFPGVEQLHGDRRAGELQALEGRTWDAVLDTSGYLPRVVRQSAQVLADAAGHYTFISSISVYSDLGTPGLDENGPLGKLEDETTEEITGETYGPLKVLCERAVQETLPGRDLIIRPGLIVGPHDPTDRFTYWPYRVARGGEVLAPGRPERHVQFIDVRDLSEWTLDLVERRETGVFNATGPEKPLSMGSFLEICRTVSGSDARFTWVSDEFLTENQVGVFVEVPLWVPEKVAGFGGFMDVDIRKAVQSGLTFRPAAVTAQDTLAWAQSRPTDHPWRAGLTPEREAGLLQTWNTAG